MTIRFAASLALALVASTSAFAAEPAPAATTPPANVTAAKAQPSENTRYCFRVTRPGSHIEPKLCGTRKDLIARGYDIDAALAGR